MEYDAKKAAGIGAYALLSYLYGSVPFVALLAKKKNIDLKKTGSKNVGAANLFQSTKSPALALSGWLADLSKGALPPLLAKTILPIEDEKTEEILACSGATAGVAGQCWPIFLSFSGGRGVAPLIGASLMLAPRAMPVFLGTMASERILRILPPLTGEAGARGLLHRQTTRTRSGPLSVALAVCSLPLLCSVKGYDEKVVAGTAANAFVLLIRRATARPIPVREPREAGAILVYRLLYDRDTAL
ncbi:MAG: glycerol-3-phosphate acyltransferase [Rubrobacteraceae bacterium]|nr:glycerol-3-phosphate acyltransferase [Rubrobacteraceae bacterium]